MSEKNDTPDIPTLTERELAELRSMYGVYQVNRAIERVRCLEAELTQRTAERELPTSITRCMVRLDGVWITPDAALDEITRLRAEVAALKERLATIEQIARTGSEFNLNDYDHDEVCELNDAMIQLYGIVRENEEQ